MNAKMAAIIGTDKVCAVQLQDGQELAGDVRAKRLRQVVTAVSDGANAATSATDCLMKEETVNEI